MTKTTFSSRHFWTDDGVRLHYLQGGPESDDDASCRGTLLLLPGWSGSASQFNAVQTFFVCEGYRTIALDPRGHGDSAKPTGGYHTARFAQDLDNLLDHLEVSGINKAIILGHSASCNLLWSYVETFGQDRIDSLILVDQMPVFIRQAHWTDLECRNYGASATLEQARSLIDSLEQGGPEGLAARRIFVKSMFSKQQMTPAEYEAVWRDHLQFPIEYAAKMAWNIMTSDQRDVLPAIQVPTLCIGGLQSHISQEAMPWMASEIGDNAEACMVPGTHYMYLQEAEAFCEAIYDFLQSVPAEPQQGAAATKRSSSLWKLAREDMRMQGGLLVEQSLVPDDVLESSLWWKHAKKEMRMHDGLLQVDQSLVPDDSLVSWLQ